LEAVQVERMRLTMVLLVQQTLVVVVVVTGLLVVLARVVRVLSFSVISHQTQ
jgi:hypothetical protein